MDTDTTNNLFRWKRRALTAHVENYDAVIKELYVLVFDNEDGGIICNESGIIQPDIRKCIKELEAGHYDGLDFREGYCEDMSWGPDEMWHVRSSTRNRIYNYVINGSLIDDCDDYYRPSPSMVQKILDFESLPIEAPNMFYYKTAAGRLRYVNAINELVKNLSSVMLPPALPLTTPGSPRGAGGGGGGSARVNRF